MAGDKEFKIRIDTQGNSAGAKEVANAIDGVTAAAERAEQTIQPPIDPRELKPAADSLEALTDKVEQLRRELRGVSVGSDQFEVVANRVKAAEKELGAAEEKARRLGATLSRRGDAGMAVLEFSRMIEDSQYGLRGMVNNLPTLISMLGGPAGLAGVLSLLAVIGVQVWESMGRGTRENTKDLEKLSEELETARKFYEELRQAALQDLQARGSNDQSRLEFIQRIAAMEERIAAARDTAEALRSRRSGEISLAEEKLRLAREEAQIALAGGETAKALAKAREDSQKRILALEKQISEEARQRELAPLRRAVDATGAQKEDAAIDRDRARADLSEIEVERQKLAEALNASQNARLQQVEALQKELEQARADLAAEAANPRGGIGESSVRREALEDRIEQIPEEVAKLFQRPENETEILARLAGGRAELEQAQANADAATERWSKAADALTEAVNRLREGEERGAIDRDAEDRRTEIANDQSALDAIQLQRTDAAQRSREQIEGVLAAVLGAIGEAANQPAVQTQAEQVRKIIADGLQASEEGQVSEMLRRLVDRISTGDARRAGLLQQVLQVLDISANTDRNLESQLRDILGRVQALEANQGNPNY